MYHDQKPSGLDAFLFLLVVAAFIIGVGVSLFFLIGGS